MRRAWDFFVRCWTSFNVWIRHYPLPAYLVLIVGIALAFTKVEGAINQINDERTARVKVSSEINRFVCAENNKQDRILASLIEASLGGSGSSFGAGLDASKLSSFDREVLGSIAKVQKLAAEAQPDEFRAVFEGALAQLQLETPCTELVNAFKEASDTQDYQAIRKLLHSLDEADRKAAREASE